MSAIIGSIIGLIGAAIPELIQCFKDSAQRKHELALADKQAVIARETTDAEEIKSVHQAFAATGNWLVDAMNGLIRPVLTLAFFSLYTAVKFAQYYAYTHSYGDLPWKEIMTASQAIQALWSEDDISIFATIIAFWFGSRGFKRAKEK